ncbi:MAG: PQQ-binding-like beta-propeller repeat protein [Planctomycetota bacterium]|nr:PQQ-binding-like beta-propeller repeat protein [Planctomycetota bacterium]
MHKGPPTASVWILLTLFTTNALAAPRPSARVSQPASPQTRSLLLRADRFVSSGEWDEGVNALRLAMDVHGDERIRLDSETARQPSAVDPQLFVSVRQYCHLRLTAWSVTAPAALATYRNQVDPLVKQQLQTALADRDPHGLADIAHRFFASSHADEALWHLGEWALERGDYNRARWAWEQLHPALRYRPTAPHLGVSLWLNVDRREPKADAPTPPPVAAPPARCRWPLAYPDANYTLAEIRARLLLVSVLEGSSRRAETEYKLYQQLHSQTDGSLGGRQGRMVDLLRDLLDKSRRWPSPPHVQAWPTFAGNQERSLTIPEAVDLELRRVWTVQISTHPLPQHNEAETQPPYFPVVSEDLVILHDAQRIHAVNLHTGKPAFPADNRDSKAVSTSLYERPQLAVEERDSSPLGLQYFAPMLYGEHLFASLGHRTTRPRQTDPANAAENQLVGLDLSAEGLLLRGFPLAAPDTGWTWDGPPVCDGNRLHIPLRKQTDTQTEVALGRYDLTTGQLQGPLVRVASSMHANTPETANRPDNLLSLTNGCLLYNTNLGTIAAFDTERGSLKWMFHYPRSAGSGPASPSGADLLAPNPCLVHKDLAIVAPVDSQHILAIDITTGQLVWNVPRDNGMQLVHLLGVVGDRVIASGNATYAFDLYSGQLRARFPSAPETATRGYGRGLLAGNQVYWPTRRALFLLDAYSLSPVRQPVHLARLGIQGGNLVLVGQTLLIAGSQRMSALRGSPLGAVPGSTPAARQVTPPRQTTANRF